MDQESYRFLQLRLLSDPESGEVIQGTGGLRKLRWHGSGRGTRGGTRVIYFWHVQEAVILLLFAYAKNDRDELTQRQRRTLAALVQEELE
ncbi:MAG: type II toxin-antitoxin system RelE/ParE family toxin [Actinomycetota bacterium]